MSSIADSRRTRHGSELLRNAFQGHAPTPQSPEELGIVGVRDLMTQLAQCSVEQYPEFCDLFAQSIRPAYSHLPTSGHRRPTCLDVSKREPKRSATLRTPRLQRSNRNQLWLDGTKQIPPTPATGDPADPAGGGLPCLRCRITGAIARIDQTRSHVRVIGTFLASAFSPSMGTRTSRMPFS